MVKILLRRHCKIQKKSKFLGKKVCIYSEKEKSFAQLIFFNTYQIKLFNPYLGLDKMKRGTFSTFGYGPRGCIGKHFTSLEMKVTIVRLLSKFRFTIDPGFNMFYRRAEMLLNVTPDIEIRVHPLDVETAE